MTAPSASSTAVTQRLEPKTEMLIAAVDPAEVDADDLATGLAVHGTTIELPPPPPLDESSGAIDLAALASPVTRAPPAAAVGPAPADPVRCVAEFLSLGTGTDLARSVLTGRVRPLRTSVAGAAEACAAFRTPEAQVDHLCRELGLGADRRPALRRMIDDLVDDGVLASERDLARVLRARGAAGSAEPIATVGVITRDRPDALERCLRSYAENARAHGRSVTFAVSDQSSTATMRAANQAILRRLRADTGMACEYAGLVEKRAFAREMVEHEQMPAAAIEFVLGDTLRLGCAAGANRNTLLLHGAGGRMLCTDDDMVCLGYGDAPADRLYVRREEAATEVAFYWQRDQLLRSVPEVDFDVLGVHERLLGRSLCDVAAGFDDIDLSGASLATLRAALHGEVTVRVTQSGHAGDSGMGSPAWVLAQRGGPLDEWLATEATYQAAMGAREVLRTVPGYTVSDADGLMGGTMGLDLRTRPPFFPALRNEDGLFGSHLRALYPGARIGFCPIAPLHAPLDARTTAADAALRGAGRLSCGDLVLLGLATAPRVAGNAPLAALGRWFEELGAMSPAAFDAWLRDGLWRRCALEVETLTGLLDTWGDQPSWWADDVRSYLETVGERVSSGDAHVPDELKPGRTPEEAVDAARLVVRRWGRLLVLWGDLWDAAVRVRERGRPLAVRI